jgi:hypothetical protein
MATINSFQKCEFNLYQTNDGEDKPELSIPRKDWNQVQAGVSFQEYASCDSDIML